MSALPLPCLLPLARFQSWMQAVLVHPDGARLALEAPELRRLVAPEDASTVVRDRGGLDAAQRLQIYAGMYPLRMRDALRSDYPALAELLGERGFAKLVADYVAVHPSRSFTLARLGDHLPEFLAGWGSPRRRGLRTDVARLERAGAQVFDAEETAPLDADALQALPAADWPKLRLRPAAAFRLVRVRPGAVDVLDAVLEGNPVSERTGRGRVEVAYYRRDFVVLRRTLGPFDGSLLAALAAGKTVGSALERAGGTFPGSLPSSEVLSGWFAEWTRLGFFSGDRAGLPGSPSGPSAGYSK
ncbi:MAG: putative DNA-binding domain-containing protein [Holophagales bacterium]|nr:putative DNA-binding domain-containing protein [Holophagales bacterium]